MAIIDMELKVKSSQPDQRTISGAISLAQGIAEARFSKQARSDWRYCTQASLMGHILNGHLKPIDLCIGDGVPRFDIEIAAYRKMRPLWIIEKIYESIENAESLCNEALERDYFDTRLNPERYKAMLVKTLLYMQEMGLTKIDWSMLISIFDRAQDIKLDINKDSTDASFLESRKIMVLCISSVNVA
ncbi:MAG TPA: hypothetical protein VL945_00775, partial [Candidatus Saccharimonadales bacterium]|nr:hypothetical protein [Candidatus Saccharimonadales bacterium]